MRNLRRVITEESAVIAREGYRSDHRQRANLLCGFDGFLNFIQVGHGFDDDHIRACIGKRLDLFAERFTRLLELDPPIRSDTHSKRTDIPRDQHILVRRGNNSFRKFHASAVDLSNVILQAMFGQLVAVRTEGIGNDQLRARFDVFAVDIRNGGGVGQVQFVEAFVKADTACVEHGSHRSIGEQSSIGKGFKKVHFFSFKVFL